MADCQIHIETPIGGIAIQGSKTGVSAIQFSAAPPMEKQPDTPPVFLQDCARQLEEYFAKKRTAFDLPLDLQGTDFQKKVWSELLKIPYGKTVSYLDIALAIGDKNATRAVGMANNKNPIAIVVPCHRVIGKNGSMVGYASGVNRKKQLLDLEQPFVQGSLF